MYGMISPGQVSNSPILRSMLNSGVTNEIAGNIEISSTTPINKRLPGNSSRATAYAAIAPTSTAITVVVTPMPTELISAELKKLPRKIPAPTPPAGCRRAEELDENQRDHGDAAEDQHRNRRAEADIEALEQIVVTPDRHRAGVAGAAGEDVDVV